MKRPHHQPLSIVERGADRNIIVRTHFMYPFFYNTFFDNPKERTQAIYFPTKKHKKRRCAETHLHKNIMKINIIHYKTTFFFFPPLSCEERGRW